jgi:two-component system response regulator DesR
MSIRILVADDADAYRDTVVAILELEDDLEVVAEVASGDQVVPTALEFEPDVALLDIDLPAVDGLTAAARLRARLPTCRVLILTGLAADDHVHRALAVGVSGLLVKDGTADDLVRAVRGTARGDRVYPAVPA